MLCRIVTTDDKRGIRMAQRREVHAAMTNRTRDSPPPLAADGCTHNNKKLITATDGARAGRGDSVH